jgi:hypothetical protein
LTWSDRILEHLRQFGAAPEPDIHFRAWFGRG